MHSFLSQLVTGRSLTVEQTVEAFEQIMTGQATPAQVGALLAMIQMRGPTVEELTGAATVMRQKAACVAVPAGMTVIDTCGTGGDGSETFNISTAAAVVAAGAAQLVPDRRLGVAKHGNRSVTSKSGSSQVLEALGVKLKVAPDTLSRCLDEARLCFCFAPAHHPAMKHAVPIRQDLGFRTIFNLLGPLTNPAGARRQVMGVFDAGLTEPVAQVLKALGSEHAMVVHGQLDAAGARGIDELSTFGSTRVSELRDRQVWTYTLHPDDVGLRVGEASQVTVSGPQESAELVRRVLAGEAGPGRDIVCLNAAAALLVADAVSDLRHGIRLAQQAISTGAARGALDKLVELTQADPTE